MDWVGPAIQAAAQVGSSVYQGVSASNLNSRNRRFQREMADKNRAWQLEDYARQERFALDSWNMQNEYNSPANQRRLYEEAGYKYMPDGNGSVAGQVAQGSYDTYAQTDSGFSPELASQEISAWGNAISSPIREGLNAFEKIKGINQQIAQTNVLKQQALNTEANTQYVHQATAMLVSQTLGIDIDNEIKSATKPEQIAQIQENLSLLKQNVAKATSEAQVLAASAQTYGPEYISYCKNHWKTQEFQDSQNAVLKELETRLALTYKEDEVKVVLESAREAVNKIREEVANLKFYNADEICDIIKNQMNGSALQALAQGAISNQVANARTHSGKAASQALAEAEANVSEETQLGQVNSANFKNSKIYLWTDAVTTMVSRMLGAGMVGRFLYKQNFSGSSLNLQQPTLEQSMSIRASAGQGVIFDKFGNPM